MCGWRRPYLGPFLVAVTCTNLWAVALIAAGAPLAPAGLAAVPALDLKIREIVGQYFSKKDKKY